MELSKVHLWLGVGIIASWTLVSVWSLVLRALKRDESPTFWRMVTLAQILLVIQLAFGLTLFAMGRRPGAGGAYTNTFHTLYGFGFPVLVLFYSHKWARAGRWHPFAVFAFAGFVIMALALRGFMVGLVGT